MTKLAPQIAHHAHKAFIEDAVTDGWALEEGPWGYAEGHERTVKLTKDFPSLGGSVYMWLLHRNIGIQVWNTEDGRWQNTYPEDNWSTGVQAWVKKERGEQALSVTLDDVLQLGLSESYWNALANTCDNCGKVVEHLNHVAFANKACDDCVGPMRAKLERPGWYN